jgi:hypothetical protein
MAADREEWKCDHSHSYVRIGAQPVLRSRSSANRRMMAPVKFCGRHQLSSRVEGSYSGKGGAMAKKKATKKAAKGGKAK